jgi:shikimate dehydrogenase
MADSARQMTMDTAVLSDRTLARHTADAQLLVNTTSVGMYPHGDDTPVPAALLHPDLDVIDAIYRPEPTRLCVEARAAGAHAVTGVDWIIAQGVMALKYWLGLDADEAAMRAELARFLAQQT